MTRKDYIKAAELIRIEYGAAKSEAPVPTEKDKVIQTFCQFFKADNSRFDAERFRQACNEK